MTKTAIIVAAGLGSRLKERTISKPKGFLELNGKSLIERSIENLIECGIEQIYIGTGYLSIVYEKLASKYPQIKCIKSNMYETTSSMYTLYNMRDSIKDDFILLESDLLYEIDALNAILSDTRDDIILSSGRTNSGDEVYIEADKESNLINISKNINDLNSIYSELVGISKISYARYEMMCRAFEAKKNMKIDYEYMMVETIQERVFHVKKMQNLIWCEIDNDEHYRRALNYILPQIERKSNPIKNTLNKEEI